MIDPRVDVKWLADILLSKLERRVRQQMFDICAVTCNEIVKRNDLVAAFEDAIT
jgi:hypothetical protein